MVAIFGDEIVSVSSVFRGEFFHNRLHLAGSHVGFSDKNRFSESETFAPPWFPLEYPRRRILVSPEGEFNAVNLHAGMVNSEAEPVSVTVHRCQIVDVEVHRDRSRSDTVFGALPAQHSAAAFCSKRQLLHRRSTRKKKKKKKKQSPIRNEGGGFFSPQSMVSAKLFAFPNWVSEFLGNGKWVVENEEKEESLVVLASGFHEKSLERERQEPLVEGVYPATELTRLRFLESERFGPQRDWEVLDTCLNADDMKLVANAYKFLKDRGFLPNFGKCRNIVLDGPRKVTPDVLSYSTGLEVTKLAPKKWGLSDGSNIVLAAFLGAVSFLISQGIDLRPNLAVVLGLAAADAIFLGGTCLAQISSYWPPFRRRILVHEAGHLVTAYLMGCPIRGVILDPIVAMQMGIQGQAGTQFWDEKLANNLAEGRLDGTTFDRYCMVLFAGIAAEALVYGEAEGGENDENLFRGICLLLDPPLSTAEMSNQARWSVLQSYNLLKWHRAAHRAAIKALESGGSMSVIIRSIEETLYCKK